MSEPVVIMATVRDSFESDGYGYEHPCYDIECRFGDGQKFVAVKVDQDFPRLAHEIAVFLSHRGISK